MELKPIMRLIFIYQTPDNFKSIQRVNRQKIENAKNKVDGDEGREDYISYRW